MKNLFIFGLGYTARFIADKLREQGWHVSGTHRSKQKNGFVFSEDDELSDEALHELLQADAVLVSIPPDKEGDLVYRRYAEQLRKSENLNWLGVFSTTGAYGDAQGEWVDENSPVQPENDRSVLRVMAEKQWLSTGLPVHIFRLSGIYGPGRSPLDRARANAPIIEKPGHVFNRIHVDDIARAVIASINYPAWNEIYNVSDDLPAGGDEVLRYAYELIDKAPPKTTPFEQAELSPMAKEFYATNKRVNADKIKQDLNIEWRYPDYKSGLLAELEKRSSSLSD